jgi:hypothetical protein
MPEKITFVVLDNSDYLKNPIEIGLDKEWKIKSKNFDERMDEQGIYIIHISLSRIIYVGKTRGLTMDFKTRLYRHATESASQSNPKVYRKLKEIEKDGSPILVSLLTKDKINALFEGKKLGHASMIDIYEQFLIHHLNPEVQEE